MHYVEGSLMNWLVMKLVDPNVATAMKFMEARPAYQRAIAKGGPVVMSA